MPSLSAPSLLTSFPVPSSSSSSSSSLSAGHRHVTISPSESGKGKEPEMCAAVQGGGVWVYELASHQPLTSYTVNPKTTFSTPAVSFHLSSPCSIASSSSSPSPLASTSNKTGQLRRTAVGVRGSESENAKARDSVWVWDGEDEFEKREIKLSHTVTHLTHVPTTSLLVASCSSHLTVLSSTLSSHTVILFSSSSSSSSSTSSNSLVKTHVLHPKMRDVDESDLSIVLCWEGGKVGMIKMKKVIVDEEDVEKKNGGKEQDVEMDGDQTDSVDKPKKETWEIVSERNMTVEIREGDKVVDMLVDEGTGDVHLIGSQGSVYPKALHVTYTTTLSSLSKPSSPRTPYSFLLSSTTTSYPSILIPATPSSLILTCIPSSSNPDVPSPCTLILHHPLYPAVVRTLPLARNVSEILQIRLLTPESIGLVGISKPSIGMTGDEEDEKKRILVMQAEIGMPIGGMVGMAQLMGSQGLTDKWIKKVGGGKEEEKVGDVDEEKDGNEEFLRQVEIKLKASEDPFDFVEKHFESLTLSQNSKNILKADTTPILVSRLIKLIFTSALGSSSSSNETTQDFCPTTGIKGFYPRETLKELIQKGRVRDRMWVGAGIGGDVRNSGAVREEGVLGGLLRLGDWELIESCLKTFPTVPSSTLVVLLQRALHPTSFPPSHLAAPSLSTFLLTYIRVPIAQPLHRQALFKGLRNVEDVVKVLEVLGKWVKEGAEKVKKGGLGMVGWEMDDGDEAGMGVGGLGDYEAQRDLEHVIQHITLILDAHLSSLLNHPPAYDILESLQTDLLPARQTQADLSAARNTIDAFVRSNKLMVGTIGGGVAGGKKGKKEKGKKDVGKKREFDGMYSVEEIVL